ncbi:MAG: response regulator [Cellvibrionaceae bacterium]
MIRILVVDDHDLVRTGLSTMLQDVEDFEVVAQGADGEEGIKLARELEPDVVLMDVKMPGMGGLEATSKILHYLPDISVIGVSACDEAVFAKQLMEGGAKGYVTKGAAIDEVIEAVRSVKTGKPYMSSKIAQELALLQVSKGADSSPFAKLSQREMQTAMMIANGKRAQEIADTFNVSSKTVNSYRYRIFDKLKINSDVELTLMMVKHNILDPESMI